MVDREILDSWKEIAAYLKRSRRTCQTWEKELGLPIHRLDGTPKARVFAYKDELDRWMEEILKQKGLLRKPFLFIRTKKAAWILGSMFAFVLVLAVGILIWQLQPGDEVVPVPSSRPTLAIVFFENNSGDERLDFWKSGFAELLITDIGQSKFINVLRGDRIFSILKRLDLLETEKYSSEDLAKIADQGGADYLLKGSYGKAAGKFFLTVMLYKPLSEEIISSINVECQEEEIMPKMDELTQRIKADFELTEEEISKDIDSRIEDITTSSPEALKHYLEGMRYHHMIEPRLSLQEMEKAVAIDPDFAMAYLKMSSNYGQLGFTAEANKCVKKAYELSERLPAGERYLIQGKFYRRSEKTLDKAIEAYNRLLEFYPEDIDGNMALGGIYAGLEQWEKASERYELLIENKVESVKPYNALSQIYEAQGMYDKSIGVLEEYLNNFGDNHFILETLTGNYLWQGKYDLAQAGVDKAISLNLTDYSRFRFHGWQGDIYVCRGNWTLAEKEYLKLFDSEELYFQDQGRWRLANLYTLQGKFKKAQAQIRQNIELAYKSDDMGEKSYSHSYLSYLHLLSRRPEKALEECNKAWKIAVEMEDLGFQRYALYQKGFILLEMKSVDEAERVAEELKEMIEKGLNKKLIRLYYHLAGRIELERKNFDRAIEYLKKAWSLSPSPAIYFFQTWYRSSLAQAYYESGDLEKSQEEYEGIISRPTSIIYWGDIYAKSFYMLGKIYEQIGWKGKATEHYEKFLDLWKEADPGITEVGDAKERVSGLMDLR